MTTFLHIASYSFELRICLAVKTSRFAHCHSNNSVRIMRDFGEFVILQFRELPSLLTTFCSLVAICYTAQGVAFVLSVAL